MTVANVSATAAPSQATMQIDLNHPDLIETYTQGDCYALARALHEVTGWPLLAVLALKDDEILGWTHMGVRHPSGAFLDVEGSWSDEDTLINYGWWWGVRDASWEVVDLDHAEYLRLTKMLKRGPRRWNTWDTMCVARAVAQAARQEA